MIERCAFTADLFGGEGLQEGNQIVLVVLAQTKARDVRILVAVSVSRCDVQRTVVAIAPDVAATVVESNNFFKGLLTTIMKVRSGQSDIEQGRSLEATINCVTMAGQTITCELRVAGLCCLSVEQDLELARIDFEHIDAAFDPEH